MWDTYHVAGRRRVGAGGCPVLHVGGRVLAHARKQRAVPVASQHVPQLHNKES